MEQNVHVVMPYFMYGPDILKLKNTIR